MCYIICYQQAKGQIIPQNSPWRICTCVVSPAASLDLWENTHCHYSELWDVSNICLHYSLYLQVVFFLCVKKVGQFKLFNLAHVPCNILTIYYALLQTSAVIYITIIPAKCTHIHKYTVMRHMMTFWSMMDRTYTGSSIKLYHNIILH